VPGPAYSDAELDAAIDALARRERFREAEALVARAAPRLQRVLAQALAEGGWFAGSHEEELRRAVAIADEGERMSAVRVLATEEARLGMLVGVAVGWALRDELARPGETPTTQAEED
jgi:hypothetical protein